MYEIDTSFREKKLEQNKRRSRRKIMRMAVLGTLLLSLLGGGIYLTADQWSFSSPQVAEADLENELVLPDEVAGGQSAEDIFLDFIPSPDEPVFSPVIMDLAGDPLLLHLEADTGGISRQRVMATPEELLLQRVSSNMTIVKDNLVSKSERLMTTLPSSQEDFAFFRAQRDALSSNMDAYLPTADDPFFSGTGSLENDLLDDNAGWGEALGGGEDELPEFAATEVENTTSVAFMRSRAERFAPTEEFIVRARGVAKIETLLVNNGVVPREAKRAATAMENNFGTTQLDDGGILAVRGERRSATSQGVSVVQLSAYSDFSYIGSIAKYDNGEFGSSSDPWLDDNLLDRRREQEDKAPKRKYRLLDGIYSAGARNNVPAEIVSEAIIHLAKSQDLNAFATREDRLVLIYSERGRDLHGTAGKVLYVGIDRKEDPVHCFVFAPPESREFACDGGGGGLGAPGAVGGAGAGPNGMVTPVKGVLTSRFGPRNHPILKTVRVHKGVDWAAPTGTPVVAAFDGRVSAAGNGGGYGNIVRISHDGGRETRYAHLSRFAANAKPGTQVKAGDVIGFVGTTGRSTGPHLHFELRVGAQAIDPLKPSTAFAAAPAPAGPVKVSSVYKPGSNAVERLVDKIIRVESAGNARAKNPLSSATGLGQFISSTWIRMMNTYRPDLVGRLSRQQLLDLRFDPTISREMVRNLAREGESYLRARGHGITAGRLYLAHFLGMDGAHKVLRASPSQDLHSLLGGGVISANPFLRGKNVAYIQNWAERKMQVKTGGKRRYAQDGGQSGETGIATADAAASYAPVPGFAEYKQTMERVLEQVKGLI